MNEGRTDGNCEFTGKTLQDYEKMGRIGEGTYGVVYRARDRKTNEICALKKVRMDRERDGVPITTLREVRILQMCNKATSDENRGANDADGNENNFNKRANNNNNSNKCSNIVKLLSVVQGNSINNVFLVFEYCEHDMATLLDNMRQPFLESECKCLIVQLLKAVEFLHERFVFHRDLDRKSVV